MKRLFVILLIFIFLFLNMPFPVYSYTLASAFLCELGIKYYNRGDYQAALHEFNKALLANPNNPVAREYLNKIKQREFEIRRKTRSRAPAAPTLPKKRAVIEKAKVPSVPFIRPSPVTRPAPEISPIPSMGPAPAVPMPRRVIEEEVVPAAELAYAVLRLDKEALALLKQPIEIELKKSLLIEGSNIQRFLVTSPGVITIEREGPDAVLITGSKLGYTYLHLWDQSGRNTLEFLTVPPKPKGPTLQEKMLLEEELAGTFKLGYSLNWNSYESGRRIDELERGTYGYTHWLRIDGQTPYGGLESSFSVRSLRTTTDLTYVTLGLTGGRFGPFKNFTLRGFDYSPAISNLTFSPTSLRGAMFDSPAFNKKLNYIVFWGREGGGRFGDLSPGLAKIKSSFLSGLNLNYAPFSNLNCNFTVAHGWGRARPEDLNRYNYDLHSTWNFRNLGLRYEIAHDSEEFAQLFTSRFSFPNLNLNLELRDSDKEFKTATGWGWRAGELGVLLNLSARPFNNISLSSRLDVYRDRISPSLEDEDRWNQNFNLNLNYKLSRLTSLGGYYLLQNHLGEVNQYRYQSPGLRLTRSFEFGKKRVSTYFNYRHQINQNYSSPSLNYTNDKVKVGLRMPLIGGLNYYINKEYNWLKEELNENNFRPHAMETGLDWSGRILETPFYGNVRFIYRDEEDTNSSPSILSGEDYIEGYAELSFRPKPDVELYSSGRIRNIWAEEASATKRIEADLRAGMRYLWDTGLRWDIVGNIEGCVFKDYNGDGLRDRNEPPIEGAKIWLGKDRYEITDVFGYYKFTKVRAKKAYVTIDPTIIPPGFMLTVPARQEVLLSHGQTSRINFGFNSRTEIYGRVFEDVDKDGILGDKDKGVANVTLMLEDGRQVITDTSGRYFFRNVPIGRHTLTLELESLPSQYMPTVPIFEDIELSEGVSYRYDIPVRKIK
ncbi:MAG: hypothetical protein DRP74_02940 [Candidatus Omnitrophota bacterium]|nr:MAG: hypothetical protein DRP74_02940 [Candidatus Omnitrophota bacterium]